MKHWLRAWLKARDGRGCRARFSRIAHAHAYTFFTKSEEKETVHSPVLFFTPRGFPPSTPVSLLLKKTNISNSNSIENAPYKGVPRTAASWYVCSIPWEGVGEREDKQSFCFPFLLIVFFWHVESILPARRVLALFAQEMFFFLYIKNPFLFDQVWSLTMVGYWPGSFLLFLYFHGTRLCTGNKNL